jgi:hypothetical protein
MKYLKYFQTETERSAYKDSSNFILPNVNYVVESDSVNFNPYVPKVPQKAGDIVYYVNGGLKTIGYANWDSSLGTPIGVIIIPEGFAPDRKARMVALSGESDTTWGGSDTNIGLTIYTKVPITDNVDSTSTGSNKNGYLPSDNFTGVTSYVDSVAKYGHSTNRIPSPYAGDAPNPEYYKEISGNNALSDFNGLENTRTLVEFNSTRYRAANHCWTYKDAANSDTQWYLPACGELGYMIPRLKEIQAGLAAVSAVRLGSYGNYWSSSEYSSNYAYHVGVSGSVDYKSNSNRNIARP